MQTPGVLRNFATLLGVAALSACGGGSSADLSGTGKKSQIDGTITGFGSIIVDGVRYTTNGTDVDADGVSGSLDDLSVGMVVTLEVDEQGNALFVRYRDNVEGEVTSVDLAAERFVVLGQVVQVDALTTFDDVTLPTLAVGDRVEVSGVVGPDGVILASYVERESDLNEESEVLGRISGLDNAAQSFMINGLSVDFGSVARLEVPNGVLQNGLLVEVEGVFDAAADILRAREIEAYQLVLPSQSSGEPGADRRDQEFEVSGVVRDFNAASETFSLNNFVVQLQPGTEFDDGPRSRLVNGARVEVEGQLDANGALLAREVSFESEVDSEVEGTVDSVNVEGGELTLLGGLVVLVTSDTRLRDETRRAGREFSLRDIAPGDRLEIVGVLENGQLRALRLEREGADSDDDGDGLPDEDKLRGPVESIDSGARQVVVQGVTVQVLDATRFDDFRDEQDFFARVQVGSDLEVEGRYNPSSDLFDAAEIESDDFDDEDDDDDEDEDDDD